MRSHADATVTIQTSAEFVLSPPSWFGEVALLARYLPRDAQRGGLIKQRSGRVGDDPSLYLLLLRYALAYFSFWFSARLPAWKKPGSDEGTRSPRMNPIKKEGLG